MPGSKGVRHLPPLKGEVPRRGGGVSYETIYRKFVPKFPCMTQYVIRPDFSVNINK